MKNCAIFTRVSTTMQAEVEYNSCEAQRDKIPSYIKSQEDLEVFKEYSDPGSSGGDADRTL
jgi:DNA invertase Pin-like site-specific DNA recombinase